MSEIDARALGIGRCRRSYIVAAYFAAGDFEDTAALYIDRASIGKAAGISGLGVVAGNRSAFDM